MNSETNNAGGGLVIRPKLAGDDKAAAGMVLQGFGDKYLAICGGGEEAMREIVLGEMKWRGKKGNVLLAVEGEEVVGLVELLGRGLPGVPDDVIIELRLKHLGVAGGFRAMYLTSILGGETSRGECMVSQLCVARDARRRGVARRLLGESMRRAREHGSERLSLWVAGTNEPAKKLYFSEGFDVIRERKSRASGRYFDIPLWLKMSRRV